MEVVYFLGVLSGMVLMSIIFPISATVINKLNTIGTLKIDHSNPEKDVYRLEFNDLDVLATKKTVILKIDNKADLSHK